MHQYKIAKSSCFSEAGAFFSSTVSAIKNYFQTTCQVSKVAATVSLKSIFINNLKFKKMKQVILAIAILIGISVSANAQTSSKKEKKSTSKMEMKDHVCTSACANGNHVYAHGEKGHTCTADCKKMENNSNKMELKDHVCTDACKNGQHMYAHGEKGHTCGEACKKKM